MKNKASSDFFLLSKALVTASNLRADINKVENALHTLGYKDKESFELLDAMGASANLVFNIINDEHAQLAEHLDGLMNDCAPDVRFDSEADSALPDDKDEHSEDETVAASQERLHCQFVPGHWYRTRPNSTAFLRVLGRNDLSNPPRIMAVVHELGKNHDVRAYVHVNHNRRWLGEPTEYVKISLGKTPESDTIVSSINWVPRKATFGDQ
jgi:hypothetical protein